MKKKNKIKTLGPERCENTEIQYLHKNITLNLQYFFKSTPAIFNNQISQK